MVAQTRHSQGGQGTPTRLGFKEKLVTKGQNTDTLLRKLKTLHNGLNELDQENVELGSLGHVKQELLARAILLHTDKGVKAYAACCLVDILGLYAPEAPYTEDELADIFAFVTTQLGKGLKTASDTYFPQYFHVLESLSSVKSVVLVCDLPGADGLINHLFRDFFGVVRNDFSKQIESFMADILIALIDEAPALPAASMTTVLAQFTDKNIALDHPALRLAVAVCRATGDKLQRHVSMYFSDLMVESADEEDLSEMGKAHELIKHIHASCPNLLHSVVPLLEEQLRADDVPVRTLATETLADMYADKGGVDLSRQHHSTWRLFVARMNDKVTSVRVKTVESARAVFNAHAELRVDIEEWLQTKLMDPDERVRAAVCRVYAQVDFEVILHHVPREHLQELAGRAADKKHTVRVEVFKTLGKLYNLAYPLIENNDPAAIHQFSWIPNNILPLVGMSLEGRPAVEQTICDFILPLPTPASKTVDSEVDETRWTDRLLTVMNYLEDEKAVNALFASTNLKSVYPSPYQRFLEACVANNGGVIDENEEAVKATLARIIKQHSLYFPDSAKATEDLEEFADLNDQTLYKLLQKCMDPQTDAKSLAKRRDEFLKRLADKAVGLSATMTIFLRRGSYQILNQSSIPTLLRRVEEGQDDHPGRQNNSSLGRRASGNGRSRWAEVTGQHAGRLLAYAAKHMPQLFKAHRGLLVEAVREGEGGRHRRDRSDDEDDDQDGDGEGEGEGEDRTEVQGVALRALSCLVRWDPAVGVGEKRMIERYARYATGRGEKHAKFAARLLAHTPNQSAACGRVVETLAESLSDAPPEELVAHVSALAQFSLYAPDAFESKSDVITEFLVKRLLMVPSPKPPPPSSSHQLGLDSEDQEQNQGEGEGEGDGEGEEEWAEDDVLPALYQAKVLALKTFRNRCRAYAGTDKAVLVSEPPLRIFGTLVQGNGSLVGGGGGEDPVLLSRLRLAAALAMVQLSAVTAVYAKAVIPRFQPLALVCQDTCYNVRYKFLTKLITILHQGRLPELYNIIPFLTVHDPDSDLRATASAYIGGALRRMLPDARTKYFGSLFIRYLHFLAHHPDFVNEHKELQDHSKYIRYYLEMVATADNVPLLYHFAVKGKTVHDVNTDYDENFWIICELAQEIIRALAKSKKWPLTSYPGKVKLPQDILKPPKTLEEGQKISEKELLTKETVEWVEKIYAKGGEVKERKPAKRKAAATNGNGSAPKRARKKRKSGGREDDDDDDLDEDDEDMDGTSGRGTSDDVEMADAAGNEDEDGDGEPEPEGEEQLGRGARQRAKRKAKRKPKAK